MENLRMIWLILSVIFLCLTVFSLYYLFYPVAAFFLVTVLLNTIIFFFDSKKKSLWRFFIAIFNRFIGILFLILFLIATLEGAYSFLPIGAMKTILSKFTWFWLIFSLMFYSSSVIFGKIIMKENYKNLAN